MQAAGHGRAFDAAIIGAGPAGSATARWLARAGARVALIERTRFDAPRIGESLAPNVQPLLRELGVWNDFLALHPLPSLGTRSVWGEADPRTHSHLVSPWGCGWHVDRRAFDQMLAGAARAAGAVLLCGTTPVRGEPTPDGWRLTLVERNGGHPSQRSLEAGVIIDATGRGAHIAQWLGAKRLVLDHLVGVGTEFTRSPVADEGYVLIESTVDGWWYSAPMPGNRMMTMLMTDGDLCRHASLSTAPRWHACLSTTQPTRERLVTGTPSWGPRVFSAVSHRLRRPECRSPWLAVGDAALAVDPISGSGVVRALGSARSAARVALALLGGESGHPMEGYETELDRECTDYLHERALYYAMEQRWSQSEFWQRRSAAAANFTGRSSRVFV